MMDDHSVCSFLSKKLIFRPRCKLCVKEPAEQSLFAGDLHDADVPNVFYFICASGKCKNALRKMGVPADVDPADLVMPRELF